MYNRNSHFSTLVAITASGISIFTIAFIFRYHKSIQKQNPNNINHNNNKNHKNVIHNKNDDDDETNDISDKISLSQSAIIVDDSSGSINQNNNNNNNNNTSSASDIHIHNHINNNDSIIHRLEQQRQEERTGRLRAEIKLRQVTKELQQMKDDIIRLTSSSNTTTKVLENDNNIIALDNNNRNHNNNEFDRSVLNHNNEKISCQQNDNELNVLQYHNVNQTSTIDESTKMPCNNNSNIKSKTLLMDSIGIIRSPYTKRMGTPRQPQLVPNSYGYIQFYTIHCPISILDGIMDYSHIWIIFEFHANTTPITTTNSNNNKQQQHKKTKIRPPRAPKHIKIGQLASRSPHRPNPIGLSLCKLEYYDINKHILYISGIDLVNNTPIYDIKPFVPWDIPSYYQLSKINHINHSTLSTTTITNNNTNNEVINGCTFNPQQQKEDYQHNNNKDVLIKNSLLSSLNIKVPEWVIQEDEITIVQFSNESIKALEIAISNGYLEPFYCIKTFNIISNFTFSSNENNNTMNTNYKSNDTMIENNDIIMKEFVVEQAKLAIQQILAQDPRSSHKGLKINARGTKLQNNNTNNSNVTSNNNNDISTNNDNNTTNENDINNETASIDINCNNVTSYHIIFGQIKVTFCVLEIGVYVTSIEPITFHPDNYVDGIPLTLDVR